MLQLVLPVEAGPQCGRCLNQDVAQLVAWTFLAEKLMHKEGEKPSTRHCTYNICW